MNNKKIHFNLIDLLILLLVAAVAFVLLYVFVFSDRQNEGAQVKYTTIQYVIEVQNVEERFENAVSRGHIIQDAIQRKTIGTVVGVQASPFVKRTFDYENGKETVSTVSDRLSLKITVEAQAIETDRAFSVDGCEIRVGQQYSIMLPEFYGIGYCIEIIDKQ